jgi:DNA phosphorothioation system restriction enzyme
MDYPRFACSGRERPKKLADLPLRMSYRSDEQDLLEEFYIPCLAVSVVYSRAVGFFSSSSLTVAAKGLHVFLRGGGIMRLVASPLMSMEDVEAIRTGYATRSVVEEQALVRELEGDFEHLVKKRLELLAWLIQYNRLDIKIASCDKLDQPGIYHEKIGIFHDGEDFVAFTGSPNESSSGLVGNFESIDVYCSWRSSDSTRAWEKKEHFDRLWEDRTTRLRVYSFPDACKQSLLRFRGYEQPRHDPEMILTEIGPGIPTIPSNIQLRPYQEAVIRNWCSANHRGTLKMATGSGKTITALGALTALYQTLDVKAVIVVVPFKHLVMQWRRDCEAFNLNPICCFENRHKWESLLRTRLYNVGVGNTRFLSVITTNATFSSPAFQQVLQSFPAETLLIADEVHNMGARRLFSSLPDFATYRLGLSATPERWFDEVGTEGIFEYFGPVVKPEFTIKDALACGALVPYFYKPCFVELTPNEAEFYDELSRKIGKLVNSTDDLNEPPPALQSLLIKRARLLATARNKIERLKELMRPRLDTTHTLFYCGDGSVETSDGEMVRHIDEVCRVLGSELGYRVNTYTAEDSLAERQKLTRDFEKASLQGLVAIRCLDEGVDIPVIRTAFILASSSNPRQFIQRRGRVLRPHPSKGHAEIFDFIVLPPDDFVSFDVERSMLRKELIRYVEFARLAMNNGEAMAAILELQKRYDLLDL